MTILFILLLIPAPEIPDLSQEDAAAFMEKVFHEHGVGMAWEEDAVLYVGVGLGDFKQVLGRGTTYREAIQHALNDFERANELKREMEIFLTRR